MPFLIWPVIALLSGGFFVKIISDEAQDTAEKTVPAATNNVATMALVFFAVWVLWKQISGKNR